MGPPPRGPRSQTFSTNTQDGPPACASVPTARSATAHGRGGIHPHAVSRSAVNQAAAALVCHAPTWSTSIRSLWCARRPQTGWPPCLCPWPQDAVPDQASTCNRAVHEGIKAREGSQSLFTQEHPSNAPSRQDSCPPHRHAPSTALSGRRPYGADRPNNGARLALHNDRQLVNHVASECDGSDPSSHLGPCVDLGFTRASPQDACGQTARVPRRCPAPPGSVYDVPFALSPTPPLSIPLRVGWP